jgi:hypothetical protein
MQKQTLYKTKKVRLVFMTHKEFGYGNTSRLMTFQINNTQNKQLTENHKNVVSLRLKNQMTKHTKPKVVEMTKLT